MKTANFRFIGVAIAVCLFAIGMATLLNYFKYKSTLEQVVRGRMLVIGYGIENSIQSSLALGLGFTELGMLPSLVEREKASDRLVTEIDVFDATGKILYSTDRPRVGKFAAANWLDAATRTKGRDWQLEESSEFVAGMVLKNNFDLTVGYLALRYDRKEVDRSLALVGARLAAIGVAAFLGVAVLVSLALVLVLRRFQSDMHAIEQRLAGDPEAPVPRAFAEAVGELSTAIRNAEDELARVGAKLAGAK